MIYGIREAIVELFAARNTDLIVFLRTKTCRSSRSFFLESLASVYLTLIQSLINTNNDEEQKCVVSISELETCN